MMVQFSIMPISDNSHLGKPVAKAVKIIHESGLEYRVTAMGTLIKGDWKEVMDVVKKCHDALRHEYDRVMTQIKIDDVKDGEPTFDDKIRSVEEKAGMEFKK
ncbi:MAG: MTH1187 family thiamine-binding protein [bacterium]